MALWLRITVLNQSLHKCLCSDFRPEGQRFLGQWAHRSPCLKGSIDMNRIIKILTFSRGLCLKITPANGSSNSEMPQSPVHEHQVIAKLICQGGPSLRNITHRTGSIRSNPLLMQATLVPYFPFWECLLCNWCLPITGPCTRWPCFLSRVAKQSQHMNNHHHG